MAFWSSTTTPLAMMVRDRPASKLPAIPPNDSSGVTTVSNGASTGSALMTAMTWV